MLVIGSLLLCISALVNGDNVTLGIKKDDNVMNTRSCIYKERQALHLFKANLVDTFNSLVDWSSEGEKRDCCKWQGVHCGKLTGRVIKIVLSSFVGLAGKISSSLRLLQQLQYLNLNGIDFHGPIPRQLASLSNLLRLDVSHNILTGSIPFFLGGLTSLTYLDLSGNRLVGVIPLSFNNCSSLVQLNLSENFLNGSVPSLAGCSSLNNFPDFNGCLSLLFLDPSSNQLTGSLPNSVGKLSNLEHLDVSSNSLMGVISAFAF
nr:putative leucine-rich repeat protein, plant-type [Tanacetum cinerariifolium]